MGSGVAGSGPRECTVCENTSLYISESPGALSSWEKDVLFDLISKYVLESVTWFVKKKKSD